MESDDLYEQEIPEVREQYTAPIVYCLPTFDEESRVCITKSFALADAEPVLTPHDSKYRQYRVSSGAQIAQSEFPSYCLKIAGNTSCIGQDFRAK